MGLCLAWDLVLLIEAELQMKGMGSGCHQNCDVACRHGIEHAINNLSANMEHDEQKINSE